MRWDAAAAQGRERERERQAAHRPPSPLVARCICKCRARGNDGRGRDRDRIRGYGERRLCGKKSRTRRMTITCDTSPDPTLLALACLPACFDAREPRPEARLKGERQRDRHQGLGLDPVSWFVRSCNRDQGDSWAQMMCEEERRGRVSERAKGCVCVCVHTDNFPAEHGERERISRRRLVDRSIDRCAIPR